MSPSRGKQFNIALGDTVSFCTDDYPYPSHLFIVVTLPSGNPPSVVLVNFTSLRKGSDTTVVLDKGDHPFIKKRTVVDYRWARIKGVRDLKALVKNGDATPDCPCRSDILKRIQDGVLRSPDTPIEVKKFYEERFGEHND